ncbi:sulfatase-like hydrolase/transferase [Dokdonella sp. MW10]|uniref:sulfatase-like hydrolase/transferase n=1 Tax=Dokdonella sp. MW10 TaxID=2992926 RepID=UPI003F7F9504
MEPPAASDPTPSPIDAEARAERARARASRRLRRLRAFAVLAFLAVFAIGPLDEKAVAEKLFAGVLMAAVTASLLFASARVAFALVVAVVGFGALLLASSLKFAYLLTPVLAPDLEYYLTFDTLKLIGRYPLLLGATVVVCTVVPLLILPAWRWEQPLRWRLVRRGPRAIVRVAGAAATAAIVFACVQPDGPFARVFNKPMWATVVDRSYITAFFTSFSDTDVRKPAITGEVDRSIAWTMDTPLRGAQTRPDVVAVLEESTFDPRILAVCTLPVCEVDMFRKDRRTRAGGPLTVHTFGGGTWTSEFALLTGLADVLFGNAGLYAPYNLAPRVAHTLPDAFKAAGYRAIAIYPVSGDYLNARNAYADYGFDAFYDGNDYGLDWHSTDADLLRVFRQVHAEERAAHPNRPLFIVTLTLHQHGPHMTPLAELPPPFDQPLFRGKFTPSRLDDWLNLNLGNYLARLHASAAMLRELEAFLWGSGRPVVLMHFGDHQPSFDGAMHSIPKKVPKTAGPNTSRITYYMLKTSFTTRRLPDYDTLDIVYLGSMLLDAAGVPKDAFYQANALLRERCKGRYLDCADKTLLTSYHDHVFNTLQDLRE